MSVKYNTSYFTFTKKSIIIILEMRLDAFSHFFPVVVRKMQTFLVIPIQATMTYNMLFSKGLFSLVCVPSSMLNTWLPINLFGFNKVVEFFRFAAAAEALLLLPTLQTSTPLWLAYVVWCGGRAKNACWVITH